MTARAGLALVLVAGCGVSMGESGPWVPAADIDAPLATEVVQPDAGGAPGPTLRVVTFNVELAAEPDRLAAAIADHAELSRADVILVQEIEDHPAEGDSRASRLAAALDMGFAYAPARTVDGGTHGLAILSRWPMTEVEVMALPRADLTVRPRHRIALAAVIDGIRVVNVHLDTRINITDRVVQLRPAVLDEPVPTLVGGDFNTNPYHWNAGLVPDLPANAVVDTDQAALLDDYMRAAGYDTPTAELGPTQDAGVARLRLDAIYTRGLDTGGGGVDRSLAVSDHWPLWLDVQRSR